MIEFKIETNNSDKSITTSTRTTMGNYILGAFFRRFRSNEQVRLLILGLDAAGKTTILYKMKLGEVVNTIPTIGFNVETLKHKNIDINCWDVGGGDKIYLLWRHYYKNTHGLIFVVDSNDRERIEENREKLHMILFDEEMRGKPVLIFANKMDLPGALSVHEITEGLGLLDIRDRKWIIQASNAPTGVGLKEGFDWMANNFI